VFGVDGGVDRGVLVTAVDADEPVDVPFDVELPDESVALPDPTASAVDGSADDPVTDVAADPEPCAAELDVVTDPGFEDADGRGPSVCGPG
jgi:hypothetical protein